MRKNIGEKDWFCPLPVLIVGSYDKEGKADAMNAARGGIYDHGQIVLSLSEGRKTTRNILKKRAFTVSFADAAHVTASDYVGLASAHREPDKLEKAGFHTTGSSFVAAPLIDELPALGEQKEGECV